MELVTFIDSANYLWSPFAVAALVVLAVLFMWMAFAPARPAATLAERLDDYVERPDVSEEEEMSRSFGSRALVPLFRRLLGLLGGLLPSRNIHKTEQLLAEAGHPGSFTALDFMGLRLLSALLLGGGGFLLYNNRTGVSTALLYALLLAVVGYFLPYIWLRRRGRQRRENIQRAMPDAIDMLTIGVEAGLGFEAAMLRVSAQWDNALTRAFRRAVAEMRVGTPRAEALQRMADRTGVPELRSFVAVLNQSTQLGVSVADVLRGQAADLRERRRQRAEEIAQQASVKMVFPLVFFVFPAMLVILLGPSIPAFIDLFATMSGG